MVYDEVRVEHPLPDGWQPGARVFQTEDTPAQWMERYVLRADGRLIHEASGAVLAFDGGLTLYTDNLANWGPFGYTTDDDLDAWTASYEAVYCAGHLVALTGRKAPYRDTQQRPHLPRAEWHRQQAAWQARQEAQSLSTEGSSDVPPL